MYKFRGNDALKEKRARQPGNYIFSDILEGVDKPEKDRETTEDPSASQLLTSYMQNGKIRVTFVGRVAALVVQVDMNAAKMSSDISEYEGPYLLVIGGCYLQRNGDCTAQNGHNEFEVHGGRSQHSSQWFLGLEQVCLLVCPTSYTYVCYPTADKMKLSELLSLEKVAAPVFSIVVEHECKDHGNVMAGALIVYTTIYTFFDVLHKRRGRIFLLGVLCSNQKFCKRSRVETSRTGCRRNQ